MTCEQYRRTVEQQFDAGDDLSSCDEHAAHCPECAAYRAEVFQLAGALAAIPLESPRVGFEAALKARLAQEIAPAGDARWWLGAAALVACSICVATTWYYAVPVEPKLWWDAAKDFSATFATSSADWAQEIALWNSYWNDTTQTLARVSGPALWMAAAAAIAMLVVFNGMEARRMNAMTRRRSG